MESLIHFFGDCGLNTFFGSIAILVAGVSNEQQKSLLSWSFFLVIVQVDRQFFRSLISTSCLKNLRRQLYVPRSCLSLGLPFSFD